MALTPLSVEAWTLDFTPNSYTVNEADGMLQVGITLTQQPGDYSDNGGSCYVNGTVVPVGGSAVEGSDYNLVNDAFSFSLSGDPNGLATESATVSLNINNDTVPDNPKNILLSLGEPGFDCSSPVSIGNNATINITDDDATPPQPGRVSLDSASYSVSESGSSITISATRSDGADSAISVDFSTTNGTAVAGQDFNAVSGTLNWADGESGTKTIVIPITPDSIVEPDETFTLNLSNPSNGVSLGTNSTTVTILDDDNAGVVNLDNASYSVSESGESITISATRSDGADSAISVDFSTTNGTAVAGQDFDAVSGTLNWADGESGTKTIVIPITPDSIVEPDETFILNLSNPSNGVNLGTNSTTVTILDDDNAGVVNLDNATYSIDEKAGHVTISATRSNGSSGSVTVDYNTHNGTAVASQDFDAVSGTLNWADGESGTKTIVIPITPDSIVEPDETFILNLSNPSTELSLGTSSTTVTILDDDNAGVVNLDNATYSIDEKAGHVTISATRSNGSSGSVTVDYNTHNGTAVAGQDFNAVSGILSWADGESGTKTIDIPISADSIIEPNESFSIDLSNPTNALTLGTSSATVTIMDETTPGTVAFKAAQDTVAEGNAITVTVERSGGVDGEVRVDYATADHSALAGSDYTGKSGTLVWNDGDASPKTITIDTAADSDTTEQDELFSISLSNPTGTALGAIDTINITITNTTPQLSELNNLTPNQRSIAAALDQSCAAATGDFRQRCDELYLSGLSNEEKRQILDAIAPEQIASQGSAAVDFGSQQLQVIHGRIVELRNRQKNSSGISVIGFSMDVDGENVALGKVAQHAFNNALGGAAGDEPLRDSPLGFFLKGQIKVGDKNKTGREKGFALETKGITLGVDYRFTDTLIMGMAAGYGHTNTDFDNNGGDMTTQSGDFAVYGSYFLPKDFYVDWVMSYAIHDYEMDRRIIYPGMISSATSNPQGDQYGGSVGFGKDIYIANFFISPYIRGEYIETTIDQYNEQGGAGFALSVADQSISSLTTTLGSQFSQSISMPWGILAPGARFEWVHQFEDSARAIQSQFVSAPAGTGYFTTLTDSPDRDYFNLGASIAATLPEGRSAFFRYETRVGQSDLSYHLLELGVRIPF